MNVFVCMCLFVHLIVVIRAHDEKFKILGQNFWQICKYPDIPSNFQASHNYSHVTSHNICDNEVYTTAHVILLLERLAANSCSKASENVLLRWQSTSRDIICIYSLFVLVIMFVCKAAPM